ncbi:tetrathionate reductase family octaheme c-type cytochrome [Rhodoferax sp. 4810]|uniref:Tetrathionate reductase family octaheme c-type cytochrome n=1 Tax=Thiospirillum jenense TaxID=1653858 RepID=A0A839H6Z2_9GAMM|nr:tetrathionate reductase family octaheme c-type cytochrome [Thiospirillum jenense]MBB1074693.1 tetrathionate reductase family octaheme c-type cytochrome [Rhodoferax jenense]MBB1125463.1 tetrathionate reductase family octaheme c-type cytochrome [Thiospirillum jenense]
MRSARPLYAAFIFFVALAANLPHLLSPAHATSSRNWPTPPVSLDKQRVQISDSATGTTADHRKFEALKQPFTSGPEVTKACLSCHTETGHQFMRNIHWTWDYVNPKTGQQLGKRYLINNFCTNSRGNEGMCAQCHAGYGWKDENFDFTNQNNIDCLVCHDSTGTYYKTPNSNGSAACSVMFEGLAPIDWKKVAQHVELPKRANCGTCHFQGGGGDNVKHGDLSTALTNPPRELDVHMSPEGENFACTACHITREHVWAGSRYDIDPRDTEGVGKPGQRRDVASCESCHGLEPHPSNSIAAIKLNDHVSSVACQTCHIPTFARGGVATMIDWDWRTAGKTRNGEGYHEHGYIQGNGEHRYVYKSIKGNFTYDENLVPLYAWFDGQMQYTTIDTRFDLNKQPIAINSFTGSRYDGRSRIWPFKRMHTWQPADIGYGTLVYNHLWGEDSDSYWGNYDMSKSIAHGMKAFNLPYSGQFGFIETYSYWPITHMVAPKEQALKCSACHQKDSRLAGVSGIYLPGRDGNHWLDVFAIVALVSAATGITGHSLLRKFGHQGEPHA